jgi:4-oxalmesaconate hydratase
VIIDCHAHFTSEPKAWHDFRAKMVAALERGEPLPPSSELVISDDEIRAGLEPAQIAMQRERGVDRTIFSARASAMGHHLGDFAANLAWSRMCNDMIHRICTLYPTTFAGGVQLPQSVGGDPKDLIGELERCVLEYGFVSCNLNPDPSGGSFSAPPITDRSWYPFYEKLVELDVPAMVHVSGCCNPAMHTTSSYYLNGDTTGFTQLMLSDIFRDFPTLKFIIPHGGGAIPYHWGRFRGISFMNGKPELTELMANNIFFDTCVYHQPGIDLLTSIVPINNIIFASELVGAVKGVDPETGFEFDNTRRYVEAAPIGLTDRAKIFEGNPRRVFSRLAPLLKTP